MKFNLERELDKLLDSWSVATEGEGGHIFEAGRAALLEFFYEAIWSRDLSMVFRALDIGGKERRRLNGYILGQKKSCRQERLDRHLQKRIEQEGKG